MPIDGKLRAGETLRDHTLPAGYRREVVSIVSGRMPTPEDLTSPMRGSATEMCALHGGSAHHDARPARGAGKQGHL